MISMDQIGTVYKIKLIFLLNDFCFNKNLRKFVENFVKLKLNRNDVNFQKLKINVIKFPNYCLYKSVKINYKGIPRL